MDREKLLDTAKQYVCQDRDTQYGAPEDNFETICLLWNTYLRAANPALREIKDSYLIRPQDVAMMMTLMKVARAASSDKEDNFADIAGYAACASEICFGNDDNGETTPEQESSSVSEQLSKTVSDIAFEILRGKYGKGAYIKDAVESEGYDYSQVQSMVNRLIGKYGSVEGAINGVLKDGIGAIKSNGGDQ